MPLQNDAQATYCYLHAVRTSNHAITVRNWLVNTAGSHGSRQSSSPKCARCRPKGMRPLGTRLRSQAALGAMGARELSFTQCPERPAAMRGGCIRRLVRNELHEKQGSIVQKTINSGSVWKMSNKFCQSQFFSTETPAIAVICIPRSRSISCEQASPDF